MDVLIQLALFLLGIVLPIWAIIDFISCMRSDNYRFNIIWLLLIIFFPIIGAILYFQVGKRSMRIQKRTFSPDFSKLRK